MIAIKSLYLNKQNRNTMSLQAAKLDLIQKLLLVNQESIIKKLDDILENEMIVGYTVDGRPLTKTEYNHRLVTAEQQLKNGEIIDQEDLERESDNW